MFTLPRSGFLLNAHLLSICEMDTNRACVTRDSVKSKSEVSVYCQWLLLAYGMAYASDSQLIKCSREHLTMSEKHFLAPTWKK